MMTCHNYAVYIINYSHVEIVHICTFQAKTQFVDCKNTLS